MAIEQRSTFPSRNTTLISLVLVVAGLYFARIVLIPFALAVLLSFLLAPLVIRLRHWHFGRVPSVVCVVALSFAVLTIVAALVSNQVSDLAHKLPGYQQNIEKKLHSFRASSSGTIKRLTQFAHNFGEELAPAVPSQPAPGQEKPVPVEIRGTPFSPLSIVPSLLGSLANVLLVSSIVIVYVIFILFQREDLRDRLIRLVGAGRINLTTRALDDAAQRVSRYLLAQLAINAGFGVLAGIGLALLHVPNPILWGVLAALLRYVPYLGIWFAAAMPAAVSLAISPGWLEPVWIFALFFGIDLCVLNLVEPLLYGSSTGISPMAILVAAVFWTWLWGPIGLLLATPLTVCLVVLGRYVPSLEFLSIALSDEQVLTPEKRFYQRLLARDVEEAKGIAEDYLKEHPLGELYDEVVIPALSLSEEERHQGKLDDDRQQFLLEHARILVDALGEPAPAADPGSSTESSPDKSPERATGRTSETSSILTLPARDEADELSAIMLGQLLSQKGIAVTTVSANALASECIEEAGRDGIRIVCVCAVPPFGYMHARYLCKRLRAQFPKVKIIAAILNERDAEDVKKRDPAILADAITTSLKQTLDEIIALDPVSLTEAEQAALSS